MIVPSIFIEPVPVRDNDGCMWIECTDGTSIYCGREVEDPSLKEFNEFIKKTGFEKVKSNDHWFLIRAWKTTHYSFYTKMNINDDRGEYFWCVVSSEFFVHDHYIYKQIPLNKPDYQRPGKLMNGLEYPHDNTVTQVVCAYILDFWHNHRELHQHVWQCGCCGKFQIKKVTESVRGRKKEYCSDECKIRFGLESKEKVRESVSKHRDKLNENKEIIAHDEIIDWLCDVGDYISEKAEEIFKKEKHRNNTNVKSLANFKRTYGKRNGLI